MEGSDRTLIRVLGPIDMLTVSGPRSAGGRNGRALLGALALGAGRAVSVDALRWAIWGESQPVSADNSVQTYVSRLRQVLGHDRIVRDDHSYRLVVVRHQVDALLFEDTLAEASALRSRPAEAAARCREALALWRGDPFGDLCDDEPFRLETMRLEDLRSSAVELSLEMELRLGHHDVVAAELESAVREQPERERLWYLLVEALLAGGRRVEALRACGELRATLAAAGLPAGADLERLESTIRSDRSATVSHTDR